MEHTAAHTASTTSASQECRNSLTKSNRVPPQHPQYPQSRCRQNAKTTTTTTITRATEVIDEFRIVVRKIDGMLYRKYVAVFSTFWASQRERELVENDTNTISLPFEERPPSTRAHLMSCTHTQTDKHTQTQTHKHMLRVQAGWKSSAQHDVGHSTSLYLLKHVWRTRADCTAAHKT